MWSCFVIPTIICSSVLHYELSLASSNVTKLLFQLNPSLVALKMFMVNKSGRKQETRIMIRQKPHITQPYIGHVSSPFIV